MLNALDCTDDAGISDVKKQIATMETALKNLEKQKSKYSAELEDALKQYAELKAQAADVDAVERMDARLDIRPDRERSAADRVKVAYGDKYDPLMMYDSNQSADGRSRSTVCKRVLTQTTQVARSRTAAENETRQGAIIFPAIAVFTAGISQ